jgi:ATP-dependent RNA helicase RhlE
MLSVVRQNLLFSATLSKEVENIRGLSLRNPEIIKIEDDEDGNVELINQMAYRVSDEKKGPLLRYIIKRNGLKQVLVFTSSVFKADSVANKLRVNGIQAAAIHSKKSQGARTEALSKFKSGKLRVLVATDLMARGIDVKLLPVVINYELPRSPKDYIHRIGRTGRAGTKGEAISLVSPEEEHHFKVIQKKMGKKVELNESTDIDLQGY